MLTIQDMHNLCCQRVPRALGNLRFDIQVIKYMQLTDIEPNSDLYSIWQACSLNWTVFQYLLIYHICGNLVITNYDLSPIFTPNMPVK